MVAPFVYPAVAWAAHKLIEYLRTPTGQQVTAQVVGRAVGAGTHAAAQGLREVGVPVPPVVEEAVSAAASFGFLHHYDATRPPYDPGANQNTGINPGQSPTVSGVGGIGGIDNVGNHNPRPTPSPPPDRR